MLVVNKTHGHSISVQSKSNKILSSTQDGFGGIKPGSYVKIGNSDLLYSILSSKNIFYSKNFEVIDGRKIKINNNTEIYLQKDDLIKIIYDEYKLSNVLKIVNPGRFYKEGDVLNICGGILSVDIQSGSGQVSQLIVDEINESGQIKRLSLKTPGKYIEFPKGQIEVYGGLGTNCVLELNYTLVEERNILEKVIKNIEFKDNETYLTLDYSLPLGLKKGGLSLEKWEITLSENYQFNTQLNVSYQIFKDFTPHLELPLLVKNSASTDLIVNKALHKLDAKIKELEDKISKIISS